MHPLQHQHTKYLALRKLRTCPALLKQQGLPPQKDAVFVIVGQHWCLAVDRDYSSLEVYIQQQQMQRKKNKQQQNMMMNEQQSNVTTLPGGGGPAFIDALLSSSDDNSDYEFRRKVAEDYLSLEGSYGVIRKNIVRNAIKNTATAAAVASSVFCIERSTMPWKEGTVLAGLGDNNNRGSNNIRLEFDSAAATSKLIAFHWYIEDNNSHRHYDDYIESVTNSACIGEWEVLECSFNRVELEHLFGSNSSSSTRIKTNAFDMEHKPKLRSRL